MFIKAFSPYLEDVTKQYTDDDPNSWMRSNEISDDHSGESDSKILPDTEQPKVNQTVSDKSSSGQISSGQKDLRKVTKKLEVSNSNK